MNFRSVLSYLGIILEIFGVLSVIPIFVSILTGDGVFVPFLLTAVASFILGTVLDKKFEREEIDLPSAIILSAIVFIIVSLIGSIPFLFYTDFLNAFFESVSGFTTTGLSVLPNKIPSSLLFWKAFSQWSGGLGILFIFLLLLTSPGTSSYYIYRATEGGEKVEASVYSTIKRVGKIYSIYTLAGIVLLFFAGMPLFDSVITAFSSISTGSFSSPPLQNPIISVIIMVLMILGATSFFVHNNLWKGKFRSYINNIETRFFWMLVVIFTGLLTLTLLSTKNPLFNGFFQTISALTTTGFSVVDIESDLTKFLLIILMFIGGYAGSTAGGIKLVRLSILSKSASWLNRKISLPQSAIVPFKFNNRIVDNSEITIISLFVFLFVVILGISTLLLSFMGLSPIDAFFQTTSAQANAGLSTVNVGEIPPLGKIILIINMIFGRLEIFPIFVLVYRLFHLRN